MATAAPPIAASHGSSAATGVVCIFDRAWSVSDTPRVAICDGCAADRSLAKLVSCYGGGWDF